MIGLKSVKKSTLNIFSFIDFAVLLLWLIAFAVARVTSDGPAADYFAVAFVAVYAAAIVWVLFYTVASIVLMIKKSEYSMATLIAYALNIPFFAILISVIKDIVANGLIPVLR